jgi:hypothetical protein
MDNRDNTDLTARLNAILASAYSGGNSFAARSARARLQRRDDEGKFAFMFGLMRLVMRQNGIPVATFSRFVGGSDRGENMGWFHVNSEDGSVPEGFYRYPVNLASDMGTKSSSVQAVLPGDYLASKGIDLKNPSSFGNFPNIEDLEFQEIPPDFMEHPDIDGAFISEDGDITIEPNEFGGYDVVDNIDPQNTVQSVDDLGEAMKAVHAIDMTRKDYVPTDFDRETMTDAQLSRARDLANKAPVATLPTDATPEAPKADPAGMSNKDLGKEVAQFERVFGGRTSGMDEATRARYDLVSDEWELRIDEHEDQFENPDFIRDPSKAEATAPVAEIPATEEVTPPTETPVVEEVVTPAPTSENPFGLEGDVTFRDADGNRVSRNILNDLPLGTEIDAQQLLPGNRMGKANFVRQLHAWKNTQTNEQHFDNPSAEPSPEGNGTVEQTQEIADLLRAKLVNENGDLPVGLVRDKLYQSILDGDNSARYFPKDEMDDAIAEIRSLSDSDGGDNQPPTPPTTPAPEDGGEGITDPNQLLEGDIFDTIALFAEQGFENSATFGNVRVSAYVIEDADEGDTINIGIEYTDSEGNLKEYNLSFPLTSDGMFIGMGDRDKGLTARDLVRDQLQGEIDADASPEEPEANVTSPEQLLEDVHMDRLDELLNYPDNVWENGNVQYSVQIFDALDGEDGGLKWSISFVDENGKEYYYAGVYDGGSIDGIRNEIQSQINQQKTPAETVTEIAPAPELMLGSYNLNSLPSATELRRAKSLDGVSETDLQDALADAIKNGKKSVIIGGKNYSTRVLVVALSSRGFDTDLFIAGQLDAKNGNTSNVDALNAYRAQNPDVTREGTDNAKPATAEEALSAFVAGTSQEELVDLYTEAIQNGRENVVVSLENFGSPEALGSSIVEIPLADFRKRLVDKGVDMDSVDDGFKGNDDAKKKIADEMGEDVVDLETGYRSDWRDVIISGSSEYNHIRFLDEFGVMQEFILDEDGKWYDTSKPLNNKRLNKGKDSSEMIRYMERGSNVDKDELIYITDGFGYDDSGDLIDEAKNAFSFNTPQDDALSPEDAAEVSRWRHITYGDLKKMLKLQKEGVVFDVLDKMQELFPNSERRSEDELVTETHEYTSKSGKDKGTKYKFEVVVTKTPNEYYYTYVRITNTKTGKVQSSRAGRMNQSALGAFRTYRREMTKFHHSFFKTGGPVAWFRSGATKIRMKTDEFDEDLGYYTHSKDLQLDRNTTASVLGLLGASPSSTQEVNRASDLVMREIFRYLGKYRHDDVWMGKAVKRLNEGAMFKDLNLGIDIDYLYAVASAYDAQISNQQALDSHGEGISFDQRTPLEVGDTVDYVPSFKVDIRRRGKVVKRLGYVDANGGYRYTDYIMVQWEDGRFQITTTRNNRLIETATGTDGSERVKYKDGYTDPRAGYGTDADGIDAQELLPQPLPPLAPAVKPERQTAQRDENSDLVLPDGTVIPEKPLGVAGETVQKRPSEVVPGDFISLFTEDLTLTVAPVIAPVQVSSDGLLVQNTVAVRQTDGTYTVENAAYTVSTPNETIPVLIYPEYPENSATPAQLNEILELLATKDASVSGNSGLMNYYLGVMDGKDMSGVYSREEVADIIQELRNSPDRTPAKPIDQAAELARVVAEEEERNGNPDAAQVLGGLADAAAIVASQTDGTEETTKSAGDNSLAGRVAQTASTMNLGSYGLKQDDRKRLPANSNPADVKIGTNRTYKGTKPTEEASALKDQMMEFGSEAWGLAQQRVVDELRQRGYQGIETYEDVSKAEAAITKEADRLKEISSFSLGNATNFGYTEEDIQLIIKKMAGDGYVDENFNVDYKKIRGLGETLTSDAPDFGDLLSPWSRDGAALIYAMANSPEIKQKVEEMLRTKKKAKEQLEAHREVLKKFFKDSKIAHDKATVDTLKELGVEFDNVSMSALGIRSSYGGSSITERGEMGKAIQEAFNRVPRAILLQLAEIMQNNKMQLVVAPTKGRGNMRKYSGHYKIAVSREHGRSQGGIQFQSAYENPYTDVFLHELWHVIQEVSPNVAQLEHAWLYDRLVSTDKDGSDVLPQLASATGSTRVGKEKGFNTVNGFVSNYLLKQYGERGLFSDAENFFSPNNKYSEVATMVMQDIFGHNGQSSVGDGMVVYASKYNGRAFAANSSALFQNESTGKWYTDKEMTDEIKNAKTYGRPVEQFDEQVKHFGMGLLLLLSDWSPTQGLGSKSENKKYMAEDLFFDMATGKWYTDSSMTTEIPSADVIG